MNLIRNYDYSNLITKKHQQNAIKLVNKLIRSGNWCKSSPHTQTYPDLFKYNEFNIFKETFIKSCFKYLNLTYYFNYEISMWCYRDNMIGYLMKDKNSLWHNHEELGKNKVSGILYLKNLGKNGTEFENFELEYKSNTWFIYPSHLFHRPAKIKSLTYRYTLASDFYYW